MDPKTLKTSWKQRLFIGIIAVVLLVSSISIYVAIILSDNNSTVTAATDNPELTNIMNEYYAKYAEIQTASTGLSSQYFDEFVTYKGNVKAFNAATANAGGLSTSDLKVGTGDTLDENSRDYLAYYIGYCADESIFDSSFNDTDNPTSLAAPLDVSSLNLIEGWYQGVVGMKLGGVREVTIPSELAYGDSQEICGGTGSPLRFIIMPIARTEELAKLFSELAEIEERYVTAYYEAQ